MRTDFIIIGGGVAGLSAANRLAESGADVTLLEAGVYPSHKICGEFLSPEALPILDRWGIQPSMQISKLQIKTPTREWSGFLPKVAATMPRYLLDEALAQRAKQNGAQIVTGAEVIELITPKNDGQSFTITLKTGERYTAPSLLMSTGRLMNALSGQKMPKFKYIGVKAHFEKIDLTNQLKMLLLPGAYFGMAPIETHKINVAGIIACSGDEVFNPAATLAKFLKSKRSVPLLEILDQGDCSFQDWMVGPVPEFGIRQQPQWPNTYFIGDAAGVIPPATGDGLAMGLTSGILAAEYAFRTEPKSYRKRWESEYKSRIRKGALLHKLYLSSPFAEAVPLVCTYIPPLLDYVFRATRGSN